MPRNLFGRHSISKDKLRASSHTNLCRLANSLNIETVGMDHEMIALAVYEVINLPAERFDSQQKRDEYESFWENTSICEEN